MKSLKFPFTKNIIFFIKLNRVFGKNKNSGKFKIQKVDFLISFLFKKRFKFKIIMLVKAIILNNNDAIISDEVFPKNGLKTNIKKNKKYADIDDCLQVSNLNPKILFFGHLIFLKKRNFFILLF